MKKKGQNASTNTWKQLFGKKNVWIFVSIFLSHVLSGYDHLTCVFLFSIPISFFFFLIWFHLFLYRIMVVEFPTRSLRHKKWYIRKWKLECPPKKLISFGDLEQMFTFLLVLMSNICLLHWYVYQILI